MCNFVPRSMAFQFYIRELSSSLTLIMPLVSIMAQKQVVLLLSLSILRLFTSTPKLRTMASSVQPGFDLSMIPSIEPPPGVTSNFTAPVTLSNLIAEISATSCAPVEILLLIGLHSTLGITQSASYDDVTSVLASVFALRYVVLVDTKDRVRYGRDFPHSDFTSTLFDSIPTNSIVAVLGFWLSKLTILLQLFRLLKPARLSCYELDAGITWATLTLMVTLIVAPVLCAPRREESFSSLIVAMTCYRENLMAVFQGALSMLLTYYFFSLPIRTVRKPQLSRK